MFSSSSAAQFTSSSSATAPRAAVDSAPDAPSTGLGARAVSHVPVEHRGQGFKPERQWSSADEEHFAALPRVVVEIIAANAAETREQANATLLALAKVQQVDDKVARAWISDPSSQKRMEKENPSIGPLGDLLREFSYKELGSFFPSLEDARGLLRDKARAKGYSEAEIDAWLASENTGSHLASKWSMAFQPSQPSGSGSF